LLEDVSAFVVVSGGGTTAPDAEVVLFETALVSSSCRVAVFFAEGKDDVSAFLDNFFFLRESIEKASSSSEDESSLGGGGPPRCRLILI